MRARVQDHGFCRRAEFVTNSAPDDPARHRARVDGGKLVTTFGCGRKAMLEQGRVDPVPAEFRERGGAGQVGQAELKAGRAEADCPAIEIRDAPQFLGPHVRIGLSLKKSIGAGNGFQQADAVLCAIGRSPMIRGP